MPGVKRREFLKVLGASGAALAADRLLRGTGKLIPYLVSPDETVPGVSTYYATTCRECSAACGIIAETRDGRAIKLEGNPDHPLNHGALCARGQAALQGLYNPDRLRVADGEGERRVEGDHVGRRDHALEPDARAIAARRPRTRSSSISTRAAASRASSTGWLAAYGMPRAV